jgi:tryptophanyl-tRNA synthetase
MASGSGFARNDSGEAGSSFNFALSTLHFAIIAACGRAIQRTKERAFMRVLSGIQPSGELHLGNYFGAIRQYVRMQREHDCFFFVANYHALTSLRDAAQLRKLSLSCAADYLALGLDPNRATIFLQSDLPEVTELTWLLDTVTPMGLLQRCHAYKEKIAQGLPSDHGLFAYPVLMAADILIHQSELVPVGQDQKQHVEVCRDIAERFNSTYGELFRLPAPYVLSEVAIVPGADGRKMSKSYGNTLGLFEPEKSLKSRIMSIRTDSTPVEAPKDPDQCKLFALVKLLASADEKTEIERRYRAGGIGYGEVKKRLLALMLEYFREARERRKELEGDTATVRKALDLGAEKARASARPTLRAAREAVGL